MKEMYTISFAPLQGYTEDVYRRIHQDLFGGVDEYYTPFVRFEHGEVRKKDMRDVRPEFNEGVNVIPQIIANGGKEMKVLVDKLMALDYKRIDINMGCPFPLQTRHGRGAGVLQNVDAIKEIAYTIKMYSDVTFSVKMRLGLENEKEWEAVIPLLNNVPLSHIAIHPRIASQQYKGEVKMDAFDELLAECKHPVIYNGDITSTDDIHAFEEKYGDRIQGIMIGRGLLCRPSLAQEYKNGVVMDDNDVVRRLKMMHDRLWQHYEQVIPGEAQRLAKIRTFWDYTEATLGRKSWKKIMKAGNLKNYFKAVAEL